MAKRKVHENSLKNLKKPWSKENQPKGKNGRKPSLLKKYIEDNGISAADVSAMAKYVLPLTQAEIQDLATDESKPFMMRLYARAIIDDMAKGNLNNVLHILDRAIGKLKETHEISGGPVPISVIEVALSPEESAVYRENLGAIYGERE